MSTLKLFHLQRDEDVHGISGTGRVAEGVEFEDGTVVIHWNSDTPSTTVFRTVEELLAVHGHEGATKLVFDSEENAMNPIDAIKASLTPGSPFNPKEKIWRSVFVLSQYAQINPGEVMDYLLGDLAAEVVTRPSAKPENGIMVALQANLLEEGPADPEAPEAPAVVVFHGDQIILPGGGGEPEAFAMGISEENAEHGKDYPEGEEPE